MSDYRSREETHPELITKRARVIMLERVWKVFVALALTAVVVLLLFNNQASNAARNELLDCTVPGGECYQRSQQNTAKFIAELIKANQLGDRETQEIIGIASYCADQPGTQAYEEIESCVISQLDEEKP